MDLIEAYYAVASHLEQQAALKTQMAEMLAKIADAMSNERVRQNAESSPGHPGAEQA